MNRMPDVAHGYFSVRFVMTGAEYINHKLVLRLETLVVVAAAALGINDNQSLWSTLTAIMTEAV